MKAPTFTRNLSMFRYFSLGAVALACSASGGSQPNASGSSSGSGGSTGSGGTVALGGSSGSGGTVGVNVGGSDNNNGCPTSLSGTVYDPAGKLPLYGVVVYVPKTTLDPISQGASCETCDGHFSGQPVAAAVTDAAGHFKMDDVPAGADIPVVIQVGKWRRQITVPNVTACADNPVDDPELFRLPRNQSEGDLPKIAVARGGSDALECLFRKVGVEDAEFTADSGNGRVHLYAMPSGSATSETSQLADGTGLADVTTLLSDIDKLMGYDMLLMGCEGSDDGIAGRSVQEFVNVRTYADQGGRIFGTHYQNQFIRWEEHTEDNPYPDVVKFASGAHGFGDGVTVNGTVNTSFPKGQAISDWLQNVGGTTTPGQLAIKDGEHTIDSMIHPNAQPWISTSEDPQHSGAEVVQYFSFPTPVDGPVCGRMVFTDIHVGAGSGDSGKLAFPTNCESTTLSPQELALAFMIFDLSSCVQPEDDEIVPPVVVK